MEGAPAKSSPSLARDLPQQGREICNSAPLVPFSQARAMIAMPGKKDRGGS